MDEHVVVVAVDISPEALRPRPRERGGPRRRRPDASSARATCSTVGEHALRGDLREPSLRGDGGAGRAGEGPLVRAAPGARWRPRRAGRRSAGCWTGCRRCSSATGSPCSRSAPTRGTRFRPRSPSSCRAGAAPCRPTLPACRGSRASSRRSPDRDGAPVRNHRPRTRPEPAFPVRMLALDIDGTLVGQDMQLSRAARCGDRRGGAARRARLARDGAHAHLRGRVRQPSRPRGADHRPPGRHRPRDAGARSARMEVGPPPARGRIGRILSHQPMAPDVIADAVRWCFANDLNPHINTIERMIVQEGDPNFADYSAYLGREAETVRDLATDIRTPMTQGDRGGGARAADGADRARRGGCSPGGRARRSRTRASWSSWRPACPRAGPSPGWRTAPASRWARCSTMGDALNDVEMIVDAGHGAAMATAPAEVQLAARYVAAPVDQDGAAALIEALVLAPPEDAARQRRPPGRGGPGHPGGAPRPGPRRDACPCRGSCRTATPPAPRPCGLLRAGLIVAVPTDTVYGIAADLALPDAIERLFAAKRRPPEKAVAVLLADMDAGGDAGRDHAGRAGAGRAVLARRPDAGPAGPPGRRPAAGARRRSARRSGCACPDHDAPRALARALGPLPTTSANVSGEPDARDAQEIAARLGDAIALVIDGGPIHGGPASTVVDCTLGPAGDPARGRDPRGADRGGAGARAAAPRHRAVGLRSRRVSRSGPRSRPASPRTGPAPATRGTMAARLQRPDPEEVSAVSQASVPSAAWAPIAEVDPELWAAMEAERHRQTDKIELIASENYVFAGGERGAGLLAHQQVRRGAARQALLRRLRARGRRREPGQDPRARAVPGLGPRQRPAPLRRPGQHGGLLRRAAARATGSWA